jgi:signal peptidase I
MLKNLLSKIFPTSINAHTDNKTTQKAKSQAREWFDAIIIAVLAASVVRWGVAEAITIPTPSMQGTIMVGDFLFVSKLHYGARTPQTPLQIPFTHQTIWGTNANAYLDWIKLPMFRFPAFSSIKRNDVVVFNYAGKDESKLPIDMRTNFIKRCVALPNDELEISNTKLYINGKLVENSIASQSSYYVIAKDVIPEKAFRLVGIDDVHSAPNGYHVHANTTSAKTLQSVPSVEDVIPIIIPKGEGSEKTFPYSALYEWNLDNFGALTIPAEGMTMEMNEKNVALYESVILQHEDVVGATVKDNKLYINDLLVKEYTFKQNYYFMMGDNRHASDDSRVWGFVPENHITGKAVWIWWSINPEGGLLDFFSRIRWDRIGNNID